MQDIKKISCIGTGVIGSSWATYFMLKGYPVILYDLKEEFLEASKERIKKNLEFYKEKDIITESKLNEILSNAKFTTAIEEAVKDVQFIQESGPEKYEIKRQILGEIEKYTDATTIIASSTSGLLITEIAKFAKHPERCIGAHPYNPPHLIPLVEMTKGEKTSEEVLKCAYNFYKSIDKEPIILQKEALGFIANRLQTVLYREAVDLVMRGVCSLDDIDKACLYGPGLRYGILGPNLIFHLGGGQSGIKGMMENIFGPSAKLWLPDVAKWEEIPDEWPEIAEKGIEQAILNRSKEQGRTSEEIAKFRDDMLVEILKLHGKF